MYTKMEIRNKVKIQINKINQMYKCGIMNYTGRTVDTNELFTEVISEELLKLNIKKRLNNINVVVREKGYRVETHDGVEKDSNRREEKFAIKLFNWSKGDNINSVGEHVKGKIFSNIGKILDYQIPLKNSNSVTDKGLGKIDLISVTDDRVFLIELKIKGNKETILRCVLEIATYYQVLSKSKFLDSYSNEFEHLTEKNIKKAILIVNDSLHHKEMEAIHTDERRNLKKLMDELEVEVFRIDPESLEVYKL
jgi:hypothetical protein